MKGLAVILLVVLASCNGETVIDDTPQVAADTAKGHFFPLTSFLKGQLLVLDSLPVTPLLITTRQGKSDSVWVKKGDLAGVIAPFLHPVITATNVVRFFKESKFTDQTINANTFLYEPAGALPDSLHLRNWTIYVNTETGYVDKVYMVKTFLINARRVTQQLTWKTNHWAKIVTLSAQDDGTLNIEKEEFLLWNFNTELTGRLPVRGQSYTKKLAEDIALFPAFAIHAFNL